MILIRLFSIYVTLDTNIILLSMRSEEFKEYIYQNFLKDNTAIICVVTEGEIYSLATRNGWGERKIKLLDELLENYIVADIHSKDVTKMYAQIDAFSQGRLKTTQSNFSARNMGKNDIWIAAVSTILDAILITTDNDFDHLDPSFLKCLKVKSEL